MTYCTNKWYTFKGINGNADRNYSWQHMTIRRLPRYSLRTVVLVLVAANCVFSVYANWRNERAAFLRSQNELGSTFAHATSDLDYRVPRAEIVDPKWACEGCLPWLGLEPQSSIDVLVVQAQGSAQLADACAYKEVARARSLFPEAQLVVGVVPASIMARKPTHE